MHSVFLVEGGETRDSRERSAVRRVDRSAAAAGAATAGALVLRAADLSARAITPDATSSAPICLDMRTRPDPRERRTVSSSTSGL